MPPRACGGVLYIEFPRATFGVIGAPQCGQEAARFETSRAQSGHCMRVEGVAARRSEGNGTNTLALHLGHSTIEPAPASSIAMLCSQASQLKTISTVASFRFRFAF
jgi:hypothetical protein